jgi:RHS repeat-associated protein
MVQATSLTSTIAYTYSADGLRVAQNVDGVETTFAWDAVPSIAQVLATTEAGTANSTRYLHGVDLVAEYRESAWQYPLGDSLGSVRQVVDAAGDVTYAAGYTPFGEVLWHAGEATTAWGFTGEWQDPNVGMIYLRARWYAPAVGRFTRQDPWRGNVQQPATGNPYVYGLNNPLTCTDPTGEWCLGGFDAGPGAGCTPEEREKWARIWTNVIDDAETASYFVLGFGVEVLDTLLLMGAGTLAKAYVEKLFAEYPVPELSLMLLLLDNDCNEFDLELYKALRDPYAFVDPGYLWGAAFGRFILLFYGGASIFGGTGGLIAATVTGPPGWFFGGVSISVAAQGAAVIGIVIVKEIADPLILTIAATGSPGGGGGGSGDGGGDQAPGEWGPKQGGESGAKYEQQVREHLGNPSDKNLYYPNRSVKPAYDGWNPDAQAFVDAKDASKGDWYTYNVNPGVEPYRDQDIIRKALGQIDRSGPYGVEWWTNADEAERFLKDFFQKHGIPIDVVRLP